MRPIKSKLLDDRHKLNINNYVKNKYTDAPIKG